MAAELARYGVPVRIVEKAAERTDKSKALVIWSRTLELLDRGIGYGVRSSRPASRRMRFNFFSGEQRIGRGRHGRHARPYPYALMLAAERDRAPARGAARTAAASTVEREVELHRFTETETAASRRCCVTPTGARRPCRPPGWSAATAPTALVRHALGVDLRRRDAGQRLDARRRPHRGLRAAGHEPAHLLAPGRHAGLSSRSRAGAAASSPTSAAAPAPSIPPTRRSGRCRRSSIDRGAPGMVGVRPDLARSLPHQRAQGRRLPPRPRLPRRRRRAHPQPGRRPGHEHRHAGRLQPRLEAGPGRSTGPASRSLLDSYSRSAARSATRCSRPQPG